MRLARTYDLKIPRSIGIGACLLLAGCGATEPPPPPPPPPLTPSIAVVSGADQETVAGGEFADPFVVRVFDARGPRPAQKVTFFVGSLQGSLSVVGEVQSGSDGTASIRWRPGPEAGIQTLTARLSDQAMVTFPTRVRPGPPHRIARCCDAQEHAPLGSAVAFPPQVAVQDSFRNRIPGVTVTFRLASGGGTIADSVRTTNSEGVARLGHWTLGSSAPLQTVSASAGPGLTTTIGMLGAPHAIAIISGDNQRGNVGTYLKQPLAVRLFGPGGTPLGAGFPVGFSSQTTIDIRPGGPTDSTGTATSGRVQVSSDPGTTIVTASSFDQSVTFTLTHSVPTPQQLIPLSSDGGLTFPGNLLSTQPSFRLVDSVGDPVGGHHPITFTASNGGAVVAQASTNAEGIGSIHAWRLGTALGEQSLRAVYQGTELPGKLTTTVVPAPAASQFSIEVRFRDTVLADSARQAIRDAAIQWATAIVGDLPDVPLDLPEEANGCHPALRETVDDLLIFVSTVPGDGPGGALAGAAPCVVRQGSSLPLVSLIVIDEADLEFLGKFRLGRLALHEMGHALGFGAIWETRGLFHPPPSSDEYLGLGAAAAYSEAVFPSHWVPVERDGGPGTRYSHWANNFPDLMVGFLNTSNALSTITLGAMRDLGYIVDDRKAEPFPLAALRVGPFRNERFEEWVPQVPLRSVDAQGRVPRR